MPAPSPLTKPSLDSPVDGAQLDDIRPTLTSVNVSSGGTKTYEFEISDNPATGAGNAFTTRAFASSAIPENSSGKTNMTVNQDLQPSTKYYWHARVVQGSSTSDWSDTRSFQTKIAGFNRPGALFDPLVNGIGPLRRLLILLGLASNPYDFPPEDRILDNVYDRLLVYPVGKSRVLAVEFRSKDPELAAAYLTRVQRAFYAEGQDVTTAEVLADLAVELGVARDLFLEQWASEEAKQETWRDYLPSVLVLACGLAIAAGGFLAVRNHLTSLERRGFEVEAAGYAGTLRDGMRQYAEVLNSMVAFVSASRGVDRWEFLRFAERTLPRYPGFAALQWVPRVAADQRAKYERRAQVGLGPLAEYVAGFGKR